MGFSIGSALAAPFRLTKAVAQTVAPVTAGILKTVAGSAFEMGKMAAGAMSMMGLPMMNPMMAIGGQLLGSGLNTMEGLTFSAIDQLTSAVTGRPVPYSNFPGQMYTPSIWDRSQMLGGFAGAATPMMYQQIGAPYLPGAFGGGLPSVGQYAGGGMPISMATMGFNNINSTSAAATANAGFMPSGNNGLDLANAIANSPTYSPAEQSLLNQIQDPQQRAMQQLQMFMQKQALLATMLSNLANMRHEMLKTVANNLRA